MNGIFDRTRLLLGQENMRRIEASRVLLCGSGGVGSWCAEGLVRSGIRHLDIVDFDTVCPSNVNRQLMATSATIGQEKVEAMKRRLLEINPEASIGAIRKKYSEETAPQFDLDSYDYVIDCIDSLKNKALLILNASASGARLFSSMGAALKLDPTKIKVAEFWDVRGCPLGAALRKKFRKSGTLPSKKFLCVYDEEVLPNRMESEEKANGSLVHITAVFGFTLAGLVIKDMVQ